MNKVCLFVVFSACTIVLVLPRPLDSSVPARTFRMMEEAFNETDFGGFKIDDDTETERFLDREEAEYGDEDYEYDEPVFYEDYESYEDIYDN